MSTAVALLVASALLGLVVGRKFSVLTMVGLAPLLALVAALAVRDIYAAPAVGFVFAYACVFASEAASLFGAWSRYSLIAPLQTSATPQPHTIEVSAGGQTKP
jgi:hypothetical protein